MIEIKGYEKLYAITKNGKVWSFRNKKYLKPLLVGNGYYQFGLSVKGVRKAFLAHRLVLNAYLGKSLKKKQVNHKNGVKIDNQLENLEWMSAKENMQHASKNNLTANKEKNGNSRLTLKEVELIRKEKGTYTDIGKKYRVSRVQISNILNNRQWILQ